MQQKINVPAWPNVAQIAQWLIQLGKNLVAVSPHSDMAEIEWLNECKHKTFEELADSGEKRFFKMDLKLSAELHAAYKNEKDAIRLMEEVQIMEEYCAGKSGMLKGRQYVKMSLSYFETDRHLDKIWQMEDLYKLEYPGDAKMGAFRYM